MYKLSLCVEDENHKTVQWLLRQNLIKTLSFPKRNFLLAQNLSCSQNKKFSHVLLCEFANTKLAYKHKQKQKSLKQNYGDKRKIF